MSEHAHDISAVQDCTEIHIMPHVKYTNMGLVMHVGMPIQHEVFNNFYPSNNFKGKQMAVCNILN